MPPAFILSQDQTLHERKERPVDSGSTYSKLGSPRATRAGRSAHSIALSGFQGAGRLPERGAARRCAVSGAGLTLSQSRRIASPAGEIFRKKSDEGFFPRPPGPPSTLLRHARRNRRAGRAQARQPRTPPSILLPTLYSASAHALPSPFFSLLPTPDGSPLHSGHALPSPFFSLPSTPDGSPLHSGHALPSPFFSLLSTLSSFFGGRSSI